MTVSEFKATLAADVPPPGISQPLIALWYDAKGDWNAAHNVTQDVENEDGAWVHAYLHRKEGDASNAAYWYRRAGRAAAGTLQDEWHAIAADLLAR